MNTQTTHIRLNTEFAGNYFNVHGRLVVRERGWIFKKYRVKLTVSYIAEGQEFGLPVGASSRRYWGQEKTRSKDKINGLIKDMIHELSMKMAKERKFAVSSDTIFAAVWWNIITGSDVPDDDKSLLSIQGHVSDFERDSPKDL